MNEELNISHEAQTDYQPTRKTGIAAGFRECDDGYLSLISNDLKLQASLEDMRSLQKVFAKLGRDPSVAELYFAYAGLCNAMRTAYDDAALSMAEGCTPDAFEMLVSFVRRYCNESGCGDRTPMLTRLAEYAATGKIRQDECGIHICRADERIFPTPYSGKSEMLRIGDYVLTLSTGVPISGKESGEVFVLLSPEKGDDTDTFILNAHEICRKFIKLHPETMLFPASERGLVSDLMDHADGLLIDTSLYPEPSSFAESVFCAFNPSLILFVKRTDLLDLWSIARDHGITPYAPASTRSKFIFVKSAEGSVEFDKSFFKLLEQGTDNIIKFNSEAYIPDLGDICINSESEKYRLSISPHVLSARKVGGSRLYEDLADAMCDKSAVYAISGTVSPRDERFLSAILTLDSYRRNNSPAVVYSRFFVGEKMSICIFKLSTEK